MKTIKWITCIFLILLLGCEEDNIDINRFGGLTGMVLNGEDYSPLSGVLITTSPASSTALTDSRGAFRLKKVKEGEVTVTARKKDFLSSTVSVAVYEYETDSVTFVLMKDEKNVGWVVIYDPVPGNGAVDQNTSITFKWKVDQEKKSKQLDYTVYYFKSGSTVQQIAGENLSSTEVTVDGLDYATTYYWYVVAKYEGDKVSNSPTWSFKTKAEKEKED